MTCFYCVYPPEKHCSSLKKAPWCADSASGFQGWEYNNVHRSDHNAKRLLQIEHPSTSDLEDTMVCIDDNIRDHHTSRFRKVDEVAQKIAQENAGFMNPREKRSTKAHRSISKKKQSIHAKFSKFFSSHSQHLGHAFCGSGLHRSIINPIGDRRMMDWALIEISTQSFGNLERRDLRVG